MARKFIPLQYFCFMLFFGLLYISLAFFFLFTMASWSIEFLEGPLLKKAELNEISTVLLFFRDQHVRKISLYFPG